MPRKVIVNMQKRSNRSKPAKKKSNKQPGVVGQIIRSLGGIGGGALGGMVGQAGIGSSLGTSLGAALSKWLGAGDYTVQANSILRSSDSVPAMHKTNQSVVVRHREYICDVLGSQNFTVRKIFSLNPGLETTFPWLAQVAANYQEYTFKGVVFHYVPTSGDAISSTNNALGTISLVTNYRATDSAPSTKIEALNEYFSCDTRPCETLAHPIECDPRENPYNVQYVRHAAVPAGEDPKTYDLGTTYLMTSGMQADNITVGELWITYEVELRKPKAANILNLHLPCFSAWTTNSSATTADLLTNITPFEFNDLGVTVATTTNNVAFTVPAQQPGTYLFTLIGQTSVASSLLAPTCTNGTLATGSSSYWNNTQAALSGLGMAQVFTVTDGSLPTTFNLRFTSYVAMAKANVFITQMTR